MIEIIPTIAISKGKVVKKIITADTLATQVTNYDVGPLEMAQRLANHGFKKVHLVSLDDKTAIEQGDETSNLLVMSQIAHYTDLEIWYSGGIRTGGGIETALSHGASNVTIATIAAVNYDLFAQWIVTFGRQKLILGADVNKDKIIINGRTKTTNTSHFALLQKYADLGVSYVKLTDIFRDGLLDGPNFGFYQEACNRFPEYKILASGGVRSIDDIKRLDQTGVFGIFIGRSLFEDILPLDELANFNQSQ